ncbi:amidohydrolase family protein (plasmid) [Novosphingobium sp. BL-8A]|uniref:amidohydrolase family protein n=1 Tax=Novosphingobium sp. BL-8A TaxID=3127639 RepID=UPI003757758C
MPEKAVKNWREVTARYKALPSDMLTAYREAYPRQLELAKLFNDAGVRMMVGTDGGSYLGPGLTLRQEFRDLADAGLSSLVILQMATVNAAQYLHKEAEMGLVEIGYEADLVLLDADPLGPVEKLHAIVGVVRAGAHYSASSPDAIKRRIAEGGGTLQ